MVRLFWIYKVDTETEQIIITINLSFLGRARLKLVSIETLMDGFPEISGFPTQPREDTRSMAA